MDELREGIVFVLEDVARFSRVVLKRPLYGYQLAPARAIVESVRAGKGLEFLLVMPRQSGKNELVAQLLCFLLNLQRLDGGNIVYGAIGDGVGRGIRRLEEHLDNGWNRRAWKAGGRPERRVLGKAAVVFLSSHRQAYARGETAHHLLVIDEMQDQDAAHLQAVFEPMRAAGNATAVYLGTVRTRYDALWQKKVALEREQARDGVQRVFMVGPEAVCAENERYERFLAAQVEKHGRKHPIIASEYFLEPLDMDGGLFPERRLRLMRGGQRKLSMGNSQRSIINGPGSQREVFVATLDVAGQDLGFGISDFGCERDFTVCTVFRVVDWGLGMGDCDGDGDEDGGCVFGGPVYEAVDVLVDQGSGHFQGHEGRPSLARQLLAFLEHWGVAHVVGDATGVGEGLLNWLAGALGPGMVTPFKFTRASKAQLGVDFVALVETNRFKYFAEGHEFDDAWWFFEQARHCVYELGVGRPMERDLRWFVPGTARVSTPQGRVAVHDDRLVSAALVAEVDRLIRAGKILIGRAESAVIKGVDPLAGLEGW